MRPVSTFLILLVFMACKPDKSIETLSKGSYRATLQITEDLDLPFIFEVNSNKQLTIFNADETIRVTDISYANDSVYIKLPVFEAIIKAKVSGTILQGYYIKPDLNRVVSFEAKQGDKRFFVNTSSKFDVSGNWETMFSPDTPQDSYIAKGQFKQFGQKVTGTFRTTTGDYRFLEGVLDGNQLKLSTFDGAHAFLFTGTVSKDSIKGMFYSGNHWKEPFIALRNDAFELPNADELTFLKPEHESISFSFPDLKGNLVSLGDRQFQNKVVLVQIMGTWCPNCLDESRFLAKFYNENRSKDLEIVALAFEYAKTEESAFNSIKRLKENTGITYPILLAQYGSSSKLKANEKLPMLNHVLSYPTLIYMDKNGTVRKIHTGFNGPATGEKYSEFKSDFTRFVDSLIQE